MKNVKEMDNFSEGDITHFADCIKESLEKRKHIEKRQKTQEELDSMDMFWLNSISEQIQHKEEISTEKEKIIATNKERITVLGVEIKIDENDKIP